ncbi:MAG TPA: recombinase family protein [Candidatus Obscuribacterales bacterium]
MPTLASSLPLSDVIAGEVIGYVRVSDEQQLEGTSIQEQARYIEEWAERKGYELVAIYFDLGISGSKFKERPGLQAALSRVRKDPHVAGVTFFNFDRYFRRVSWSALVRELIADAGKGLWSATEEMDLGTKEGRLHFHMKQAFNEYQREQIVDLLYSRKVAKGQRGGWMGSRVPYGKRPEQGELVDQPEDRRNMRWIARLRKWVKRSGRPVTQREIAAYMNLRMAFFCPLDADQPYDKNLGVPLFPEHGPKHTQKLLRARKRPYKVKRPGCWTVAIVNHILRSLGFPKTKMRTVSRAYKRRTGSGGILVSGSAAHYRSAS